MLLWEIESGGKFCFHQLDISLKLIYLQSSTSSSLNELQFRSVGIYGERKTENPEQNPRSRDENQQQTQPTYDVRFGNRTRATLVGGERCHHYAIPAPQVKSLLPNDTSFTVSLQLGLKPYAGMTTTELMAELKKGYRLEKPNGCSEEM